MIILLCAINIEEIQLLKMLTIIFDEYFHILPYFLFYLWKLFSKNKKRKSKRASLTFPTSFNEYSCQKNIEEKNDFIIFFDYIFILHIFYEMKMKFIDFDNYFHIFFHLWFSVCKLFSSMFLNKGNIF